MRNVLSVSTSTRPVFLSLLIVMSEPVYAQLEEMTITAERRESSLQETPISVTAMSRDDLDRMQIETAEDIDIAVPGMRIDTNVASTTALNVALRGTAEGNAAFAISESKVGLYQNGVYRRLSAGNIALADIERIEVLRGPQGTLFGRNTLAGAINVVTRVPGQETYGEISTSYDKYDTLQLKGVIGGGLTESLAGSVSVLYKDRATGPYTNQYDGEKIGEESFEGIQGNLNWDASDSVNLLFSAYSSEDENDGSIGTPVNVTTGEFVFEIPEVFVSPPVGLPDLRSGSSADIQGADLITTWDINDSLTLKSLSHYSATDTDWAIDFTAGGAASGLCAGLTCTSGFFRMSTADQSQYSQELQLLGDTDRLDWLFGLYYYKEDTDQLIQDYLSFGPAAPASYDLEAESRAVFGQLTYNVAEQLSVTVGARYTKDDKELFGNKANQFFAPQDFASSPSASETTGKIGIDYQAGDDVLVYASYSEGFKSGSFDAFASAETVAIALEPELVDAFELGFKGDLFDKRLRLNAALFENQYTDFIVTSVSDGLDSANIGEVAIPGLEVESTWLPTDALSIFVSFTKLFDTGWDETGGVAVSGISEGDEVPLVSELQWTLGASYDWYIGDLGRVNINATAKFDDEYYAQAAHQQRSIELVKDRTIYNAGLAFYSNDDRHQVWLNGSNITNERDYYGLLNFSGFLFNNTALYLPTEPVSWELGYRYRF